jgi:hypothetical protein
MTTSPQSPTIPGVVQTVPNLVLRAEGLALLAVASVAYAQIGASWGLFALLFLVPDIFMLGYLRGSRAGALVYNLGHTTILPFAVIGSGLVMPSKLTVAVGLIWRRAMG